MQFLSEFFLEDAFAVDFYLPDRKIVLEVNGP